MVDDYAHHPTEVKATLDAARALGFGRVWALFQPHRYSRTQAFAREFGQSFDGADCVVLMDVYSAGEAPIPGVGGRRSWSRRSGSVRGRVLHTFRTVPTSSRTCSAGSGTEIL